MRGNKFFLMVILLCCGFAVHAQNNQASDLVGYYYMVDPFSGEGSQIYIYQAENGTFEGRVTWVENEVKKKFLGLVFLKNLTFNDKENEWQNGIVKYPGKKGTFKMFMKFESPTKLKVRGYWGIAMLGKSMYWTKEKTQRKQE
jgi:uncharacterized protein (DUF2147 family)